MLICCVVQRYVQKRLCLKHADKSVWKLINTICLKKHFKPNLEIHNWKHKHGILNLALDAVWCTDYWRITIGDYTFRLVKLKVGIQFAVQGCSPMFWPLYGELKIWRVVSNTITYRKVLVRHHTENVSFTIYVT